MTYEYDSHDWAMEAAFFADLERKRGNEEKAAPLFEQALDLELKAISEMEKSEGLRWSVLYRSAGWLALDCNQPRLAEKLACKALAGDPDPTIAVQLRELLEAVHSRMGVKVKAAQDESAG